MQLISFIDHLKRFNQLFKGLTNLIIDDVNIDFIYSFRIMNKTQQRQIFLGAAILGVGVFAFILMSFWKISNTQPTAALEAPDFNATLASQGATAKTWPKNEILTLPLRENTWTLVVFWANWCEPCHVEIPTLKELYETWNGPSLDIILVNVDDPDSEHLPAAQKYMVDNNIDLKSVWDNKQKLKTQLGVDKIPFHILVNPAGSIVWEQAGVFDWKSETTKQGLMRLQESFLEKEEMPADGSQQTDTIESIPSQESSPSPQ